MTRVKYATPAQVERAAQQCSARASWWATSDEKRTEATECSEIAWAVWGLVDYEESDPEEMWGVEARSWAEAEARLREGRLPEGWAWRCTARIPGCRGSCAMFNAIWATAWAPGKGPHQ